MTLVELMIVLVVLAVLAAVAWPSYQSAVQRSRRADGMAALTEIMQAQERWRANNPTYKSSLTNLPGTQSQSKDGHYVLETATESATAGKRYTATASVRTGSPQTSDARCQVLQVLVDGGNITYRSKDSGGATNAAPDPCWAR